MDDGQRDKQLRERRLPMIEVATMAEDVDEGVALAT